MQELNAVGVVVVDNVEEDLLLMGGRLEPNSVPAVLVSQEVGSKLKKQLKAGEQVEIALLAGLEAMQKKSKRDVLGGDQKKKTQLPDFLGYNSMIEDQIKRRFAIFPGSAVGKGDIWHRKIKVQIQGQTSPTWVDERYQLVALPPVQVCDRSRWGNIEQCITERHGRIVIQMNTTAIQSNLASEFSQPEDSGSSENIEMKEAGTIVVDAASGLMISGRADQTMVGKAKSGMIFIDSDQNRETNAYLETKMTASTDWQGSIRNLLRDHDTQGDLGSLDFPPKNR